MTFLLLTPVVMADGMFWTFFELGLEWVFGIGNVCGYSWVLAKQLCFLCVWDVTGDLA